jgi:formate--tetrahydrofolate ligase
MKTDIQINQAADLLPITAIASSINVQDEQLEVYGSKKAKLNIESLADRPGRDSKLILVTAVTPTPAGEGKTTTTIGLADGLRKLAYKSIVCLREPALGPVFGMKGGATGGGYAQVAPMEDINLHFTGDFHAVASAHNLLASLVDNHLHWGNKLNLDTNNITWRRVSDMNDRALRDVCVGLGAHNSVTRQTGFDIVVASEVMAILCLAEDFKDLKKRLGKITVGYTIDKKPITAKELKAHGAMAALLKDAVKPNLVQTLEGTPALVHGGPFANIAHGCNSVIATKLAMKLADYVVTEAGFGADLGAEKFINIKWRKSGLRPDVVVLVGTVRAIKHQGNYDNLDKHIANIKTHYNLPCVVAVNRFKDDTDEEIVNLIAHVNETFDIEAVECTHFADGGFGAEELAHEVIIAIDRSKHQMALTYEDTDTLFVKLNKVAHKIYGAHGIDMDAKVVKHLAELQKDYGHYPICIAKTQSSFSDDPTNKLAATERHVLTVRELRLCTGAEYIVAVCGNIMTMPGLPEQPNAEKISIDKNGRIEGLD